VSNRTLVLLKPDAVERQLVGSIVSRFETKGLKIVAMELRTLDAAILERQWVQQTHVMQHQERFVAITAHCSPKTSFTEVTLQHLQPVKLVSFSQTFRR